MCDGFFVSVPLFLDMRNDIEIPVCLLPVMGSVFTAVFQPVWMKAVEATIEAYTL